MVDIRNDYISKNMVGAADISPNPISAKPEVEEIYHCQSWRLESVICQCHLVGRE